MILTGTISTPTTSADMRPLITNITKRDDDLVPLRSVKGQFGPLSLENIRDSLSELVNTDENEVRILLQRNFMRPMKHKNEQEFS